MPAASRLPRRRTRGQAGAKPSDCSLGTTSCLCSYQVAVPSSYPFVQSSQCPVGGRQRGDRVIMSGCQPPGHAAIRPSSSRLRYAIETAAAPRVLDWRSAWSVLKKRQPAGGHGSGTTRCLHFSASYCAAAGRRPLAAPLAGVSGSVAAAPRKAAVPSGLAAAAEGCPEARAFLAAERQASTLMDAIDPS
jgi:hypothetical protein